MPTPLAETFGVHEDSRCGARGAVAKASALAINNNPVWSMFAGGADSTDVQVAERGNTDLMTI